MELEQLDDSRATNETTRARVSVWMGRLASWRGTKAHQRSLVRVAQGARAVREAIAGARHAQDRERTADAAARADALHAASNDHPWRGARRLPSRALRGDGQPHPPRVRSRQLGE